MDYKGLSSERFPSSTSLLGLASVGEKTGSTFLARDLIQASRDGEIDTVREHIRFIGRDKKKLNLKDSDQTTALHYAVRYGHLKIVKMLISNGANVNVTGESEATPLHYAARYFAKPAKLVREEEDPTPVLKRRNVSSTGSKNIRDAFAKVMGKKMSMPNLVEKVMRRSRPSTGVGEQIHMKTMRRSETAHASLASMATSSTRLAQKRGSDYELSSILKGSPKEREMKGGSAKSTSFKKKELKRHKSTSALHRVSVEKCFQEARRKIAVRRSLSWEEKRGKGEEKEEKEAKKEKEEEDKIKTDATKQREEEVEEAEKTPKTLVEMGRTWKEEKLASGSFQYRYTDNNSGEGNKGSFQNNCDVVVSACSPEDHQIRSVDALILPVISKENKLDPESSAEIVKRRNSSSSFVSYCSFSDQTNEKESSPVTSSSYDNCVDDDGDGLDIDDNGDDDVFSTVTSTPRDREESQISRMSDGLLYPPPLGINNLSFKGSNENICNETLIKYLLDHRANVNAKDSFGSTPLHYAAMRSNLDAVRQLLAQKEVNLEAKDRSQMTALHIAASYGSLDVCKLLLDAGCDMKCCADNGMSALHFAAMEGHEVITKLLVSYAEESGVLAYAAKIVSDQDTALHLAVENGHIEIVKYFIQQGANVNFVKENLITPLHLASRYGQLDIVKLLVSSGSFIEAKDNSLSTPLHTAASFNRLSVVEYLLQMGAIINCCNKDKETPLVMASRRGYVDIVTVLLKKNADVSITDTKDRTCLYIAAEEDHVAVCRILLDDDVGAQMVEEVEKNDNTPLHVAARKGHAGVVQMLVDADAAINAKNDANFTPLHLASQYGRSRIVEILLTHSQSTVNDEEDHSNTPLHLAALEGHVHVVQILLKSGAAVDAHNTMQWSPLDCAASRGWTMCAECLLDANALIEPMEIKGKVTPLHIASKAGHVGVIKLLIARKADITRKDHEGANCLDWAVDNKQKEASMAILESPRWESALRNCTVEGDRVLTPMRKMIKKLPEVAEYVFDKCVVSNDLPKEHHSYKVTCNYEYLEDTFSEWGPSKDRVQRINDQHEFHNVPTIPDGSVNKPDRFPKLALPQFFKRKNGIRVDHPLKYMVQSGQTKLLSHQLITYLLRNKWKTFGRFVYYTHLSIYLIFLMFITGYTLTVVADDYVYKHKTDPITNVTTVECVKNPNITYRPIPSYTTRQIFEQFGRPMIVIMAIILLAADVLRFVTNIYNNTTYLSAGYLTIITYLLSIIYVMCSYNYAEGSGMELWENWRCMHRHKSAGAITIWLAWINLVMYIRVFPKLGIYVVMLTEITKTFFQCFPIVVLFLIGFGLGFHVLLREQKSYETPQRSIMKASMGMLMEFEFDDIFNGDDYRPVAAAWPLYIIYLIINCVIMMNLLVGLAVDDIRGVQEQAALKRIGMQVDHTLDVETILPIAYQTKYITLEETIVVNKESEWSFWSFWQTKAPQSGSNMMNEMCIEELLKQQDELKENIRALRHKINDFEESNKRKEAMIDALIKHYNLSGDCIE